MKNNRGISLIEILVSILILALIVGPFTGIFIQSRMVRRTMSKHLNAMYAVRNEMEILMSMNSGEVYSSNGDKTVGDLLIRISAYPYSAVENSDCIYITSKEIGGLGDEILVLAPGGCKTFIVDAGEDLYKMQIAIDGSSYQINSGKDLISGCLSFVNRPSIQINLTDKSPDILYDFNVYGDADIAVYPGNHDSWCLASNGAYRVVDRCFYRDYCVYRVKVGAFVDPGSNNPIFEIEGIITVKD
ncbi:MAG TPA: prepilin-type N-terminal cleavage/methylation domain-containing protein [Clostridia bacterium]|nr:prepilin-type N-terminal cleavage/methylation domain-containing protein [Clostridia bacterium]